MLLETPPPLPPPPPPTQESEKTEPDEETEGETEANLKCSEENEDEPLKTHSAQTYPVLQPPTDTPTPSQRLGELLKGASIPGDSGSAPVEPPWLDKGLFDKGRQFYRKFLFCLNFSELLSLLLVLAQGHVLKPLVYTGRSDTPPVARRRYFSTLLHLISWFEGDVWDQTGLAHKDLMGIRRTHLRYGMSFNSPGTREKVLRVSVKGRGHQQPPNPLVPSLREDLAACDAIRSSMETRKTLQSPVDEIQSSIDTRTMTQPSIETGNTIQTSLEARDSTQTSIESTNTTQFPLKSNNKGIEPSMDTTKGIQTFIEAPKEDSTVFISQLDMAFTQYSFMGLILAHPGQLGAAAATEKEFEGLVHFWRGIGWLLGIKDEFNFCSGSVGETRELCLEVERRILLPRLSEANWDYEHMVHCLISGISQFLPVLSLPAMLKYLSYTLNIPTPSLSRRMSWRNTLQYWVMRLTFGAVYYYPKILVKLNLWFRRVIHKVVVNDKVNLLAYRKGQADLAVPFRDFEGNGASRCPFSVR
ncbi:uncharacterized protein LOC135096413 [Scylla paramamosain]|uniref:uncharacterized protein LOC135096413 n=1 Tax=Scylla paramamosain TaxID=85552 RepID=UPI003082D462